MVYLTTYFACKYRLNRKIDLDNFVSFLTGVRNNGIPNNLARPNTVPTPQPVSVRSCSVLNIIILVKES